MGPGHPRGKHQGGLIKVAWVGAAPPLQRCATIICGTALSFAAVAHVRLLHKADITECRFDHSPASNP